MHNANNINIEGNSPYLPVSDGDGRHINSLMAIVSSTGVYNAGVCRLDSLLYKIGASPYQLTPWRIRYLSFRVKLIKSAEHVLNS